MLVIRLFERKVEALFTEGHIKGTAHPAIGQEAVAVGVAAALRKGDYVTSTHRGHGHCIAVGGDPSRIMAELFGKATGYSGGRGGSQVMADFKVGFLGANGITGGSIALATGAALALRQQARDGVVACFFGDGAVNQGSFHESLNMAAIWKLPVLYICENNRFAMSMRVNDSVVVEDLSARAAGYGLPGVSVDGNDLFAVHAAAHEACRRARDGGGPTLIECKTYRLSGHSRGDPRVYRTREEEREWGRREPIRRLRRELLRRGRLSPEQDAAVRREVRAIVRAAVAFARRSPLPDPAGLEEGLFA
jgi:pyruvate dehydrogenase E1 component alpha subunit